MAPSSHLGFMPTLLALAGVDGEGAALDGQSLMPVLWGRDLERHERFLEFHPRIDHRVYNHSMVTDRWRLTLHPEGEPGWGELFDLVADPGEHENLFNEPAHHWMRDRLVECLVSRSPARANAGTPLIAKW